MPYTDDGNRTYSGREISAREFDSGISGIIERWVSGWIDHRSVVELLRMEGLETDSIDDLLMEVMEG